MVSQRNNANLDEDEANNLAERTAVEREAVAEMGICTLLSLRILQEDEENEYELQELRIEKILDSQRYGQIQSAIAMKETESSAALSELRRIMVAHIGPAYDPSGTGARSSDSKRNSDAWSKLDC